jgi:L-threonylcarbamoyladenylate synthase
VEILRAGGLVAIPTETVYGLAANADNELAVRRLFAVKGRPATHPVIVHLASGDALPQWAKNIPNDAWSLAQTFWPGPLTLVLQRSERALDVVTGGQGTVGLRVPSHPVAHELLRQLGSGAGLAAPSANRFGRVSPTRAEHVEEDLGNDVQLILDGGPCSVGVESSIVDLSGEAPVLLRPGGVPREALENALGRPLLTAEGSSTRAPGLLPSHYAPRIGVVCATATELRSVVEAQLARGLRVVALAPENVLLPLAALHLPMPADTESLARVLFAQLRSADLLPVDVAVVQTPDLSGLGGAVLDRLARASATRS